ncbi:RNA dependent RNA polymerase [Brassicibacter mesophilus]|uniref:RNA dependent RNA polymerase n=1 Tax=Brassicibacter mesophilus TaxID=745119 RepID=UPI003D21BC2B
MATRKRKQYYVYQYRFKDIEEKDGELYFNSNNRIEYPNSENLLYDTMYRVLEKEYDIRYYDDENNRVKNTIPEMFILRSKGIRSESAKKRYDRLIENGVLVDGVKYIYSEKSSSMTRTQKTVYIKADIQEEVEKHITLGKKPKRTVLAKWLSTKGLTLSSANLMPDVPNIVIIPDFERTVIEDVKMIVPYELTKEDKKMYAEMLKEKEIEENRLQQYYKKIEEVDEIFTQEYLSKLSELNSNTRFTRGRWISEGRRVKVEELDKPKHVIRNKKGELFPIYHAKQTEEIKIFPIDEKTLGYKLEKVKDYENEINCFDGMALMSLEFAKKVEEFLQVSNANAIQGRLPYIKGLFVKFDIKKYFKEVLKTDTIVDLWNKSHNIDDIDIIATESCFKAKLEIDENDKKHWLFENMEEYYSQIKKYGYTKFGIANFAEDILDKFAPTTYQLINSLNLSVYDLAVLSQEERKLIDDVIKRADTASVKLFLDMIISEDNSDSDDDKEETKTKAEYIKNAIELNERMIFDKEVQRFLFYKAKDMLYEMMKGRIRIPSRYQYITGDIIAFCEWAAYRDPDKVKGFLKNNEFYCKGLENTEQILVRYPLTHHSEVKVAPFIQIDNPYLKHLHNIIQFNTYDLTMTQLSGCDLDGDIVDVIPANTPIANNRVLKDAVEEDLIQVNPKDKALAKAVELNTQAILDFERVNLQNLTGKVTNINTTLQDKSFGLGDMKHNNLSNSMCKLLQALIIDSAKTQQIIEIPEILKQNATRLPYYFRYIYGGTEKRYMNAKSPISMMCKGIERKIENGELFMRLDEIGTDIEDKSYLDINRIHELMIDESKYDSSTYFDLYDRLAPIHNDFSTRKGEIDKLRDDINEYDNSDNAKEKRERIKDLYAELYDEIRARTIRACNHVCKAPTDIFIRKKVLNEKLQQLNKQYKENKDEKIANEIHEIIEELRNTCNNPSILASVAVRIAYEDSKNSKPDNIINRNKNYLFPWIVASEGILENVKTHEEINKTKVVKIDFKLPFKTGICRVIDRIGYMKGKMFHAPINDGSFVVKYKEGEYYAVYDVEEKCNIETTESVTVGADDSMNKIRNYNCNVVYLQKHPDELQELLNEKDIKLGINENGYLSFFIDDEFIFSVARNSIQNNKIRLNLNDYVGRVFKAKVNKAANRSMQLIINQIA